MTLICVYIPSDFKTGPQVTRDMANLFPSYFRAFSTHMESHKSFIWYTGCAWQT